MNHSAYRRAMFIAFSVPAGLFLVLPFAVVLLIAPWSGGNLMLGLLTLAALLLPVYVVGYLLSPWSGSRVNSTKAPAFLMAAAASLGSALAAGALSAASGSFDLSLGNTLIFAFFALPASVLGALLFIGSCQREPQDA